MTTAMKITGRQRRVTARNTTQATTLTMRMSWVAPRLLTIRLRWFSDGVRCAANQRGIVRSPSRSPFPLWVIMISLPMPVMDADDQHPHHQDAGGGAAVSSCAVVIHGLLLRFCWQ